MTFPSTDDSILIDEVGLATGRHGACRVVGAYQFVFARQGAHLGPVCAEAMIVTTPDHAARDETGAADTVTENRDALARLCRLLGVLNFEQMGAPDLGLIVGLDLRSGPTEAAVSREVLDLADLAASVHLDPTQVLCGLSGRGKALSETIASTSSLLRQTGLRAGLDGFGVDESDVERLADARPELVTLDRGLTAVLADEGGASLLARLVTELHAAGTKVRITDVRTPAQFEAALGACVDYVQGDLLAPAFRAGTIPDFRARPISSLLTPSQKVVPLRA